MPHLSLEFFGKLQVKVDDVPVTNFEYNKVRALLAYLALEANQPHQRDHLVGLFWPDLPERLARQNLSQALLNLREVIGDRQAKPAFLEITRETIQFNRSSDYSLDVERFKMLLAACEAHPHRRDETCTPCARRLQQAVGLYQDDFLAQFFISDSAAFEEWILLRREDLHQRALSALWRLAGYYEWRRSFDQAIQYSRRQLELDPWREEAHRQLMRLLALNGQRSAALAQFEKCRKTLLDALGVEPEAETRSLFELIRDHSGSEPKFLNQIIHYKKPASNLPVPSTPLIGRQAEAAAVHDLLLSDEVRLVTLTGTPGIGKTRLGIEVAKSLHDDFEDGIFWIDLAPLGQSDLVAPTIAHTLGVPENTGLSPIAALTKYLKDKQLLLLLDNFEQIVDAAPHIADLLAACADVKMLVTSRVALRIRAERRYPVVPLPENDAVALFVERARAIYPEFQLTGDNASLVHSICTRLDGLPLAVELIAARIDRIPLDDLAAQLDRRLALLTDGPRDLPHRQQTLRNAIDWSYALLSEDEQMLFTWLGVFVGGCTIEAIEAVCDQSGLKASITEILNGLIHKSLVQVHTGSTRYTLLETIRQYAQERLLATGEIDRFSRRHRDWCLTMAEVADREWRERAEN